ncbi:caspase family protein [Actinoplanes flavus]|uniref:Caspase family protein n=1 Tax=Actinoplanes flavus TaxID=2820290 RepID=A0ABS3UK59_9ACTN|nr:caspase family protein [Actinoplanes flavus]MBO3739163.1 caspase family protein [Actinoplanes flavus]
MSDSPIRLQPLVRWPRQVRPNTRYQVIVDLTVEDGQEWPYPAEERTIGCLLDGAPWCQAESAGSDLLVLHRFGGTYGPVRFVLHIGELTADPRPLRLTFLTAGGVPFRTVELPVSRGATETADTYDDVPVGVADPPRTGTVFALLVGINDSGPGRHSIAGAVNDVEGAEAMLRTTVVESHRLRIEMLRDSEATRDAIITRLRALADQAGPDDTVLFWFSGNGSTAEAPPDAWHLYPTGKIETLICHSAGQDRAEITAPELSDLIGRITDHGTHVAVVVDACHSGLKPNARVEPPSRSPVESGQPEPHEGSHILLAACLPHETASELIVDGTYHGVFSWSLLRALRRMGPTATYRELIAAARGGVALRAGRQTPTLYPASDTVIDQPFLGGAVRQPVSLTVMHWRSDGWSINIGACHGVPAAPGTRVVVSHTSPALEAAVIDVRAVESLVEPVGWEPDRYTEYPVVVSAMPTPPTTVAVDPAAGRVRDALRSAGPSPHLREVSSGETPDLRVAATGDTATVLVAEDEPPLLSSITLDNGGTQRIVETLAHVARWRRTYLLDNPPSRLAGAVRIEVISADDGSETSVSANSAALRTDNHGVIRLRARRIASAWRRPRIFVRLRNERDEHLYCALLDLTSAFGVNVRLFPGAFIGPRRLAAAVDGRAISVGPPRSKRIHPGQTDRTWLKLMVCQEEFSVEPFALPDISDSAAASRTWPARSPYPAATLEATGSLTATATTGTLSPHPDLAEAAADWWTTMIPIEVVYD